MTVRKEIIETLCVGISPAVETFVKQKFNDHFRRGGGKPSEPTVSTVFRSNPDARSLLEYVRENPTASIILLGDNVSDKAQTKITYKDLAFLRDLESLKNADLLDDKILIFFCSPKTLFPLLLRYSRVLEFKEEGANNFRSVSDLDDLEESLSAEQDASAFAFRFNGIEFKALLRKDENDAVEEKSLEFCLRAINRHFKEFDALSEKMARKETEALVKRCRIALVLPKSINSILENQLQTLGMNQYRFFSDVDSANRASVSEVSRVIVEVMEKEKWTHAAKVPSYIRKDMIYFVAKDYSFGQLKQNFSDFIKLKDYLNKDQFKLILENLPSQILSIITEAFLKEKAKVSKLIVGPKIRRKVIALMHENRVPFDKLMEQTIAKKKDTLYDGIQHHMVAYFAYLKPEIFKEKFKRYMRTELPQAGKVAFDSTQFAGIFKRAVDLIKTDVSHGIVPELNTFRNSDYLEGNLLDFLVANPTLFYDSLKTESKYLVWDSITPSVKTLIFPALDPEDVKQLLCDNMVPVMHFIRERSETFIKIILENEYLKTAGVLNHYMDTLLEKGISENQEKIYEETFLSSQSGDLCESFTALLEDEQFGKDLLDFLIVELSPYLNPFKHVVCFGENAAELRKNPVLKRASYFLVDKHFDLDSFKALKNKQKEVQDLQSLIQLMEAKVREYKEYLKHADLLPSIERYIYGKNYELLELFLKQAKVETFKEEVIEIFDRYKQNSSDDVFRSIYSDKEKIKVSLANIQREVSDVDRELREIKEEYGHALENVDFHLKRRLEINEEIGSLAKFYQEISKEKISFSEQQNQTFAFAAKLLLSVCKENQQLLGGLRPTTKSTFDIPVKKRAYFKIPDQQIQRLANLRGVVISKNVLFLRLVSTILKKDGLNHVLFRTAFPESIPKLASFFIADQAILNGLIGIPREKVFSVDVSELVEKLERNELRKGQIKNTFAKAEMKKKELKQSLQRISWEIASSNRKMQEFSERVEACGARKEKLVDMLSFGKSLQVKMDHEFSSAYKFKEITDKQFGHYRHVVEKNRRVEEKDPVQLSKIHHDFKVSSSADAVRISDTSDVMVRIVRFVDFANVFVAEIFERLVAENSVDKMLEYPSDNFFPTVKIIHDNDGELRPFIKSLKSLLTTLAETEQDAVRMIDAGEDFSQIRMENLLALNERCFFPIVAGNSSAGMENLIGLVRKIHGRSRNSKVVVFTSYPANGRPYAGKESSADFTDDILSLGECARFVNIDSRFARNSKYLSKLLSPVALKKVS